MKVPILLRILSIVLFAPIATMSVLAAEQIGLLGPGVSDHPAATKDPAPTGRVGKEELPTEPQTVYLAPRFGIVQMTTAGKETIEVGAPVWHWPTPTLTMPAPSELLGGHAPAWRALSK